MKQFVARGLVFEVFAVFHVKQNDKIMFRGFVVEIGYLVFNGCRTGKSRASINIHRNNGLF